MMNSLRWATVMGALGNRNVQAFLHVIREGESDQTEDAYTVVYGGTHFTEPPWLHPYSGQSAPPGKAAGAYQFIPHTWAWCATACGLDDFSPPNQDAAAVYLIVVSGALSAIEAGDLAASVDKLAATWVSLPTLGLSRVAHVFLQYGGTLVPSAPNLPPTLSPSPEDA